jgi:hypothetical protein
MAAAVAATMVQTEQVSDLAHSAPPAPLPVFLTIDAGGLLNIVKDWVIRRFVATFVGRI